MNAKTNTLGKTFNFLLPIATIVLLAAASLVLIECGGGSSGPGMGSANVTMSDPPSCTNNFSHVWITVTDVQAHTSANAPPNAAGFQDLTTQLNLTSPKQIDLLNPNNSGVPQGVQCLLAAELGSTQSLPAGSYQQLRLILADNGATGVSLGTNACATLGANVFNCLEDSNNNFFPIELSSQDQTGLKIPPGQILGGPITVTAGQSVDININLQACDSLSFDPAHNAYRLRPTLTAYQVSPNLTGVSGQVVVGTPLTSTTVSVSSTAVPGAMVAVEVPGPTDTTNASASTDIPLGTVAADSAGHFDFCPLPQMMSFDVVADGLAAGVAYDATIIQTVPNGTQLTVPVLPQTGTSLLSGSLGGSVTATAAVAAAVPFDLDANVYALQKTTGGLEFVVPGFTGTTMNPLSFTCSTAGAMCTVVATMPANNPYTLVVPVSTPLVGAFSAGTITYTNVPAALANTVAPTATYFVEANSAPPNSENTHSCTPAAKFSGSNTVNPSATAAVSSLDLTACQ
jgi:Domain of unknown function (DUF4382)